MPRHWPAGFATALSAAASGWLMMASAWGAPAALAAADGVPRFETAACPGRADGLPDGVVQALSNARCGHLVVPEDRTQPKGRTIRLQVAVLPALSPGRTAADPVVHMPGGPGGIAVLEAKLLVDAGLNRHRDLIMMSQRGTYLAEPALTCASIDIFARRSLSLSFYSEATLAAHLDATRACRAALAVKGVRLAAYNTTENAADFADLMQVLGPRFGYRHWHIFASSYGTFLARSFMRDHPRGIRSAILDSTIPLSVTLPGFWDAARAAFDDFFAACAAQPACGAAHPRLAQNFTQLVIELEAQPVVTRVRDPVSATATEIVIDGGRLVDWLRNKSYLPPQAFRPLPDLIDRLARREPAAIATLAQELADGAPAPPGPLVPSVGYGLAFGVVCREWHPFGAEGGMGDAGRRAFPDYPDSITTEAIGTWAYADQDCNQVWRVPAAAPAVRRAPRSPIPTLLISGSFDAVASVRWTRLVARGLLNATIVVLPGVGHYVTPNSACAQTIVAAFLDGPKPGVTACAAALKPGDFSPVERR